MWEVALEKVHGRPARKTQGLHLKEVAPWTHPLCSDPSLLQRHRYQSHHNGSPLLLKKLDRPAEYYWASIKALKGRTSPYVDRPGRRRRTKIHLHRLPVVHPGVLLHRKRPPHRIQDNRTDQSPSVRGLRRHDSRIRSRNIGRTCSDAREAQGLE